MSKYRYWWKVNPFQSRLLEQRTHLLQLSYHCWNNFSKLVFAVASNVRCSLRWRWRWSSGRNACGRLPTSSVRIWTKCFLESVSQSLFFSSPFDIIEQVCLFIFIMSMEMCVHGPGPQDVMVVPCIGVLREEGWQTEPQSMYSLCVHIIELSRP
jgi:hypothetical protein